MAEARGRAQRRHVREKATIDHLVRDVYEPKGIRMSSIMRRRSGVMTKLLCEMNGATWRRRIVSQRSCQTRARKRTNV